MNDENKISYYAVIPATIRYDTELKANEKLLYGEITALANKNGYCYAQNRYFAELYNVNPHTVSQWISHLEKSGYVRLEMIRSSNKEIQERRIYIKDIPYIQKNTYPYVLKNTSSMYKNIQENNQNIIDDLFNLIINKNNKIQYDFYLILNRLELLYTEELLQMMRQDKIQVIKEIIYILFEIYNSEFDFLLRKVNRESLFTLYSLSKEYSPDNFLQYYKRSIINKYTNNT